MASRFTFVLTALLTLTLALALTPATGCSKDANQPPVITLFEANPPFGNAPLSTRLYWEISDPEGDTLTCELDINGDGIADHTIESCTSQDAYDFLAEVQGRHRVTLTVMDSKSSVTAELSIFANNCPIPTNVVYPNDFPSLEETILEPDTLELLYRDPTDVPQIAVNQFIIGTEHPSYLRRVTGVLPTLSTAGRRFHINTVNVPLEEFVPDCFYGIRNVIIPFTQIHCLTEGECDGVSAVDTHYTDDPDVKGGVSIGADFDFFEKTFEGGAKFKAGLSLSAELSELVLDVSWGQIQQFTVEIKPSATGTVSLDVPLPSVTYSGEWTLGQYVLGGITLGPVVLVPKLELKAYVNVGLEPKYKIGASTTVSATAGFTYRPDEDLETWASASITPGIIDPKFELGIGSARAGLKPKINLMLYGLAGPYVGLDAYAKASASVDYIEGEVCLDARAGLDLIYGAEIDVFLFEWSWDKSYNLTEHTFYNECVGGWMCGDGNCDETETCGGCPADCGACPTGCGDGMVTAPETCDGNCPTSCDDGNPCTEDRLQGTPDACNVTCNNQPITDCSDNDGCCPNGCSESNDGDCVPGCGDGIVNGGETCDGNCPATCDDGDPCTEDRKFGSANTCDVTCSNQPINDCGGGDGCCPNGCSASNDSDCSASCGNGTVDPGETCDGGCPTSCTATSECETAYLTGSAASCTAACVYQEILSCNSWDGCCQPWCNEGNDNDCSPVCPNTICEPTESANNSCPADCGSTDPCFGMGNGYWCGNNPALINAGTSGRLYLCLAGSTSSSQICTSFCEVMPAGVPDRCGTATCGEYSDNCSTNSDCCSSAPNCGYQGYCCVGAGAIEPGEQCGSGSDCCSGRCQMNYCCWEPQGPGCTI
ncbi:MAG: hypothetical protein ABI333_03270 [bacterium]